MPTATENEFYNQGFRDGRDHARRDAEVLVRALLGAVGGQVFLTAEQLASAGAEGSETEVWESIPDLVSGGITLRVRAKEAPGEPDRGVA